MVSFNAVFSFQQTYETHNVQNKNVQSKTDQRIESYYFSKRIIIIKKKRLFIFYYLTKRSVSRKLSGEENLYKVLVWFWAEICVEENGEGGGFSVGLCGGKSINNETLFSLTYPPVGASPQLQGLIKYKRTQKTDLIKEITIQNRLNCTDIAIIIIINILIVS